MPEELDADGTAKGPSELCLEMANIPPDPTRNRLVVQSAMEKAVAMVAELAMITMSTMRVNPIPATRKGRNEEENGPENGPRRKEQKHR